MDMDGDEKTIEAIEPIWSQSNFENRLGEFKDLAGPDYKLRGL